MSDKNLVVSQDNISTTKIVDFTCSFVIISIANLIDLKQSQIYFQVLPTH